MFSGFSHVMMWATDMPRALAWYTERLGCRVNFAHLPHYASLQLDAIGLRIDLHPDPDGRNVGVGPMPYFKVADLDAALATLAARGVKVGAPKSEGGARFASIEDSEGNLLGLGE